MKRIFTLLTLFSFCMTALVAQTRYMEEVFDEVTVTPNVLYGVNATVITIPSLGEAVPQPLVMDVYEPVGDDVTERPVVLVFHTGNFLPAITNGEIAGTVVDSSAVEFCTQLAKRGFVAASVDYRGGWNPLAKTQPERALGLIQAAYRGSQDGRNAIRFIKANVADGNTFGIDTSRITALGLGTGGYLTLGLATISSYEEILDTEYEVGKFFLDADGDGTPETPMIVEAFHGDYEGKNLTVVPADGFGLTMGDTTNYPNHVAQNSDYHLNINIGGALGDANWIDEASVPMISVQSANDIFAPYYNDVLTVPTTGDPIVRVQGAQFIGEVQTALGLNAAFSDGIFDDPITQLAIDNSATAGHPYYEGTFPWIKPPNALGIDEGVVVNWWDPNGPAPGAGMGIPYNQLPHPSGGTFHDQGLVLNQDMSAEKARANIADIMAYIMPRACLALDLPDCAYLFTGTEETIANPNLVSIAPNPTSDQININTSHLVMKSVRVFTLDGKLVQNISNVNASDISIPTTGMTGGIYFVKVNFEDGILTKRVVVK